MTLIYLIRHPHIQQDPMILPSAWELSARGRDQVDQLAALPIWARVATIYTSPQHKAAVVGTALHAAWSMPVRIVPELAEVRRGGWLTPETFQAAQRDFFADPTTAPYAEWESAQVALARFTAAMDAILTRHPAADTLGVVAHGTILALYTAQLMGNPPSYAWWQHIDFCSMMVVRRADMWPVTPFFTVKDDD